MAIVFSRPLLFRRFVPTSALLRSVKAAPPTQAGTIVRPFNPLSLFRPPGAPLPPPPAVRPRPAISPSVAPIVTATPEPEPVVVAAPAPAPAPTPTGGAGTCRSCGGHAATAPAPAPLFPAPAPSLSLMAEPGGGGGMLTETTAPIETETPPATEPAAPKGKTGLGFWLVLLVVVGGLAYASYVRPR